MPQAETATALPRVVAVVGPTAAGKSAIGLRLAQHLSWPIRCCDSAQVYRGLDIGTAKPSVQARACVRHDLLDVAELEEHYSAGRWAQEAWLAHDSRPGLFVGGTGFYLRTFATTQSGDGVEIEKASDAPGGEGDLQRDIFEQSWLAREKVDAGSIHARLLAVDPVSAALVHPNNKRRALRYLWLCEQVGRPISELRAEQPPTARVELLLLVVDPGVEAVDAAIARRCAEMIAGGWLEEVRGLLQAGRSGDAPGLRTIGYLQLVAHLRGETSLSAASDEIVAVTRAYARRQRTYLRTQFPSARQIFLRDPIALDSSALARTVRRFLDGDLASDDQAAAADTPHAASQAETPVGTFRRAPA